MSYTRILAPLPLTHPKKLPTGLDSFVHRLIGYFHRLQRAKPKLLKDAQWCLKQINSLHTLSNQALKQRILQHQQNFRCTLTPSNHELLDALVTLGEISRRHLGLTPYVVQLMGALALHKGFLAEMATGEGKTLTVSLAGVLAGWSGRTCHLLTANDYLAARDAKIMQPFYQACGVNVISIIEETEQTLRPNLYQADIVYITAKELLGDFLKDQRVMAQGYSRETIAFRQWSKSSHETTSSPLLLTRGIDTIIVDEVDSLLIDEAVTPLVLSLPRQDQGLSEAVILICSVAKSLIKDTDFRLIEQHKTVLLLVSACEKLAEIKVQLPKLWQATARREELLRQALVAEYFLLCDHQYLVLDQKIVLLDEFTGRMTPSRTLSAGLHQAVEANQAVPITEPTESIGQMSFQHFFRHFRKLSGSSGTAYEAADEFWRIYNLPILSIPPNLPSKRFTDQAQVFCTSNERWDAVVNKVIMCQQKQQPVLIGVRSVKASVILAKKLQQEGFSFELLNALNHTEEARIVEQAGHKNQITIATNMAGRGTDIKLGSGVAALGGLQVIITEYNDSSRIDRQLAGRCARQGDEGHVSIYISLQDDILKQYLPDIFFRLLQLIQCRYSWLDRFAFKYAQWRAESKMSVQRRLVMKGDEWMEESLPFVE